MKFLFTMIVLFGGIEAHASGLLAPGCGAIARGNQRVDLFGEPAQIWLARSGGGLTCDMVEGIFGAAEAVHMAVVPAAMVLNVPGVREEILGQMATMGVTLANPAVLGIGVIGALGYVTVYFVLKTEAKACQKAEMQDAIRREVEERLRIKYSRPIEVHE